VVVESISLYTRAVDDPEIVHSLMWMLALAQRERSKKRRRSDALTSLNRPTGAAGDRFQRAGRGATVQTIDGINTGLRAVC
jgi:hypothetical protein